MNLEDGQEQKEEIDKEARLGPEDGFAMWGSRSRRFAHKVTICKPRGHSFALKQRKLAFASDQSSVNNQIPCVSKTTSERRSDMYLAFGHIAAKPAGTSGSNTVVCSGRSETWLSSIRH